MKILIDIGHPAHVHLFKNFARILQNNNSKILFTVRAKDSSLYLLKKYGFNYVCLGRCYKNLTGKAKGLIEFSSKILKVAQRFKPDLFLSCGSMYAAFASFLIHKPHISMEDTGNLEQIWLYKPFTEVILSPSCLTLKLGKKHIKYSGYHELAYLHPKYFVPDSSILDALGILPSEKFAILRFSGQTATHDRRHGGLSLENQIIFAGKLSKYAKVFISSEGRLHHSLEKFKINIPFEKIHNLIYYASLVYTEGATMASEASVLGVPVIYVDFKGRDYTRDQEKKYDTSYNFYGSLGDQERSIQKGVELIKDTSFEEKGQRKRENILSDTIDLTSFLVWFTEKYPDSFELTKKNPEYPFRFK